MKRTLWFSTLCVLASGWVIVACSGQPDTTPEEPGDAAAVVEEESLPDPGREEATEVEDFVRQWVTERAGEGNVYEIPPSAGHDVAGALATFHTVHQKDADTYSVCVDFQDGENTYDVDFLVDRTTEGLSVSDHYLHKINGEAVEQVLLLGVAVDMTHKIDYYHIEIPDNPGAAFRVLSDLKKMGANLLACCGFPLGDGKVQIDLVPEYHESFRNAAARLDLQLSERKRAFLIQGGDRVVAVADTFEKLAFHSVNIVAHQAISTGTGHWEMILWVEPDDYKRASEALGF